MPSELPRSLWVSEIFRAQVFQPGAHVLCLFELSLALFAPLIPYRKVGAFTSRFEHRISHIDGRLKLQRERQRITRACIGDHRTVVLDHVDLGVVGVLTHRIDDDLLKACLKTLKQIVQDVVEHRARRRAPIELTKDGHPFPEPNENGQDTFTLFFHKRDNCSPFGLIKKHRANVHLLQRALLLMPRRCMRRLSCRSKPSLHTESELIHGAVVSKDKVSMPAESESNQIDPGNDPGRSACRSNAYDTAFSLIMRHNIEILRRIQSDALGSSETTHKGMDLAIRRNAINLIRP